MRLAPLLLLLIIASPYLLLIPNLASPVDSLELSRLADLALNSAVLVAVAAAVAVPVGSLIGFTVARVPFRGSRWLHGLLLISLFIPLPVVAVAWQIILGSWLPGLSLAPGEIAWRPWSQGLLPAGIVHGIAAIPSAYLIARIALLTTDRVLEEEALATGGPRLVIRRVLLPRLRLAAFADTAWITWQTFTEIPVTDAMMVRTFAEECYVRLVGDPHGLSTMLTLKLLMMVPVSVLISVFSFRWMRRTHWNAEPDLQPRALAIPSRSVLILLTLLLAAAAILLPLIALISKANQGGLLVRLANMIPLHGRVLMQSLLAAVIAGLLTASLARLLIRSCPPKPLLVVAVLLALTPGPVTGFALKESIFAVINLEERLLGKPYSPPLRSLLYDQPSPVPSVLAAVLRFLPLALLILAPAFRSVPQDLLDQARLEGSDPWKLVMEPATRSAARFAALAVAGLTLGEVSAGKLVTPPGYRLFIHDLFDQMHYGAEPTVAALALIQITLVALLIIAGIRLWKT